MTETYKLVIDTSLGQSTVYLHSGTVGSTIDWGDGTTYTCERVESVTHSYSNGVYNLIVYDDLNFTVDNGYYNDLIKEIIVLDPNLKNIPDKAFRLCENCTELDLGNCETIGEEAFFNYNSYAGVQEIVLPSSIKTVGKKAFYNCGNCTYLDLGNCETIGESAFYGIRSLESLHIPGSVQTIGSFAFAENGLSKLTFDPEGDLISIGSDAFIGWHSFEILEFPKGLKEIGQYAFQRSSSYSSDHPSYFRLLIFGNALEHIGFYAFDNNSLGADANDYHKMNIVYSGTKEQWDILQKNIEGFDWDWNLVNAKVSFGVAPVIIFDTDGGNAVDPIFGGSLEYMPGSCIKPGSSFQGWYYDPEFENEAHWWDDPIYENAVLYAKFEQKEYDLFVKTTGGLAPVKLRSNGGSGGEILFYAYLESDIIGEYYHVDISGADVNLIETNTAKEQMLPMSVIVGFNWGYGSDWPFVDAVKCEYNGCYTGGVYEFIGIHNFYTLVKVFINVWNPSNSWITSSELPIPSIIANPYGTATAKLTKLGIDGNNFSIAGGGASVYANYSAMVTALNAESKSALELGWNIYIRTVEVPDLWISKNDEATSVPYTYTTDAQFIEDLNDAASTGLQIGYFRVNKLETDKVFIPVEDVTLNGSSIVNNGVAAMTRMAQTSYSCEMADGTTKTLKLYSELT